MAPSIPAGHSVDLAGTRKVAFRLLRGSFHGEAVHSRLAFDIVDRDVGIVPGETRPDAETLRQFRDLGVGEPGFGSRAILPQIDTAAALVATSGGTLTVPILSPIDYEELCLIRVALESKAAAEAATRITPRELDKLERVLVALEDASDHRDLETALRLNREFHHLVYVAARRALLLRMIESLWLRVGPQLSYVVRSDIYGGIAIRSDDHPHRQVLAALRSGNGRAASSGIARDIRRAEKVIVAHLLEEAKQQKIAAK